MGRNRLGVGEHGLVEGGVLVPHGEVLPDDDPGEEETQAEQHEGKTLETEPEALGARAMSARARSAIRSSCLWGSTASS